MAIAERRTGDGFEMRLAVNHLGHFALTARLVEALPRSGDARWCRSPAPATLWAVSEHETGIAFEVKAPA